MWALSASESQVISLHFPWTLFLESILLTTSYLDASECRIEKEYYFHHCETSPEGNEIYPLSIFWCLVHAGRPRRSYYWGRSSSGSFAAYIYNFTKVSNLETISGLKHSLECISWGRYAQMGITSNRLAVALLLSPKPKIINGIARRVWVVTSHLL